MTELQERISEGKWQDLIPACRAAFPATTMKQVELPVDRFNAQLGCDEWEAFCVLRWKTRLNMRMSWPSIATST